MLAYFSNLGISQYVSLDIDYMVFTTYPEKNCILVKSHVLKLHYIVFQLTKFYMFYLFISETLISPEMFAEILCDDLDLNPVNFVPAIAQVIRSQLEQYQNEQPEPVEETPFDQRVILKVST